MDEAAKKQTDLPKGPPSVGITNKETGANIPFVEHSEPKLAITEEVKEYVKPSEQQVPEHVDVGVRASAESTPVSTEPSGMVHLPMSQDEIKETLKEGLGSDFDVQKHFDGTYFGRAKYFLATLVGKVTKRLSRQPA